MTAGFAGKYARPDGANFKCASTGLLERNVGELTGHQTLKHRCKSFETIPNIISNTEKVSRLRWFLVLQRTTEIRQNHKLPTTSRVET